MSNCSSSRSSGKRTFCELNTYATQTIPEEQAPTCEKSLRKLKKQVNKAKKVFSKRIMNSLKIKSKY
jgi:hypothetical protein